jgi:predicted enzyme related to lactoylglutathione lyase
MAAKVIHVEVTGKDGPALQRLYSQIFGWTLDTSGPGGYGMARGVAEGDFTAGFGGTQDGSAGQATFYVHADDPGGTRHQIETLGGRGIIPLPEVAPGTKIALFTDPEGHVVGLM